MNLSRVVLALALALGSFGLACADRTGPPPKTDDHESAQRIEPEHARLEPGVLLAVEWDEGNSGAGISESMLIQDDGVVRYVASVRKDTKVHRARLTPDQQASLRATIESPAFAAIGSEFLAPSHIHDASVHRLVVRMPAGPREIFYNARHGEPPPSLENILAVVEAAHAMFADVNPWNTDW